MSDQPETTEAAPPPVVAPVAPNPGQTGPAQGFDPAVALPDSPAIEAGKPVEQESTTGPAQTPVHRITDFVADPAGIAATNEELGLPADYRQPLPTKQVKLTEDDTAQLTIAIKQVLETSGRADFTDSLGRDWVLAYQVMNNQSVIAVQLDRDRKQWDVDPATPVFSTVISTSALQTDDFDYDGLFAGFSKSVK